MNTPFEFIANLQYRLKAATAEVLAFKSGEKYRKIQEEHLKEIRLLERKMKQLKEELSVSHAEIVTVRNQWFEIYEDLEREFQKKLDISRRLNKAMEKRALKAENQLDAAQNKVKEQRLEIYALATELEDEKGIILKLRAQLNRDYENSSLPSSKSIKGKKITNSREKAEKNGVDSRGIKDIAERNRLRLQSPSYCFHHRKFLMIRILKRHQKQS